MALAYFITRTTYGTWLPSKGKGSVDGEHNQYGTDFVTPDSEKEQRAHDAMAQNAWTINPSEPDIVRDAIVKLSREKSWELLAVHVRTNHVHVVISVDRDPGRVMSELKARASKYLTLAGFDDATRKRWSPHGSTIHLFDQATVEDKVDYTLNRQGHARAVYDGSKNI